MSVKNGMAEVKAIVVDLDRTLLRTDKTLALNAIEIFQKCREKGLKIMVATARHLRSAKAYGEMIGADAMVVSNGAKVICGVHTAEHALCNQSAAKLLSALQQHPSLLISLETDGAAYSNKPIENYETIVSDDLASVAQVESVLKIMVRLDNPETLKLVRDCLTDDLYATVSNGFLIQIMSKEATKWNGVKAMLEMNACLPTETVYFGDDHDDLEPIRNCGLGIAVSNAITQVKDAADEIAPCNDEDGVVKWIEQNILLKS